MVCTEQWKALHLLSKITLKYWRMEDFMILHWSRPQWFFSSFINQHFFSVWGWEPLRAAGDQHLVTLLKAVVWINLLFEVINLQVPQSVCTHKYSLFIHMDINMQDVHYTSLHTHALCDHFLFFLPWEWLFSPACFPSLHLLCVPQKECSEEREEGHSATSELLNFY